MVLEQSAAENQGRNLNRIGKTTIALTIWAGDIRKFI
jgi:hypothetical protein